jgi:hypothetical protein
MSRDIVSSVSRHRCISRDDSGIPAGDGGAVLAEVKAGALGGGLRPFLTEPSRLFVGELILGRAPVVQRCDDMATPSGAGSHGLRTTRRHLERNLLRPPSRRPLHRRGADAFTTKAPKGAGERPYLGRHRRQRPRPHGITGSNHWRAVPPGSRAWPWPFLAAPPEWRVARLPSGSARGRPRRRR